MIGQHTLFAFERREEFVTLEKAPKPLHFAVISAVLYDHFFVVVGESAPFYLAVVENQCQVLARLQDSLKFFHGFIALEPVSCLRGGNQVRAAIRQGGRFRSASDAREVR
jgi:hypothetical protein